MDNQPIADFFDRECCASVEGRTIDEEADDRLTRELLTALEEAGFAGGTALELGSGDGSFSRALVRQGALAVSGLDLSPQSVGYASAGASAAGLAERLSYRVADASVEPLEEHDAVVSQRVFCCFPDPAALLANSLAAARSVYALALPESGGPIGAFARLLIAAENGWRRLRGDPFRAYVHDLREVDRLIRQAGFDLRYSRRQSVWRVLAYSRS